MPRIQLAIVKVSFSSNAERETYNLNNVVPAGETLRWMISYIEDLQKTSVGGW